MGKSGYVVVPAGVLKSVTTMKFRRHKVVLNDLLKRHRCRDSQFFAQLWLWRKTVLTVEEVDVCQALWSYGKDERSIRACRLTKGSLIYLP